MQMTVAVSAGLWSHFIHFISHVCSSRVWYVQPGLWSETMLISRGSLVKQLVSTSLLHESLQAFCHTAS